MSEKEPIKTEKNGRDEKGRFIEGNSGGPGRPINPLSVVATLKEKLAEIPTGEQITYLQALVRKVLKKAIIDEDVAMIKDIINRVDGLPEQPIRHSGSLEQNVQLEEKTRELIREFVEYQKKQIK